MAEIRALAGLDALDEPLLRRIIAGYSTTEVYQVIRSESPDAISFALHLTTLEQPLVKHYPLDAAGVDYYRGLVIAGHAFGAFAGDASGEADTCIGIALCDPQPWNRTLIVQEFHIAPEYHRRGVGRALMAAVEAHARALGMRCILCETQNTNVPAIRFYRALGFTLDGLDISLYGNDDLARGEVAVFMKKRIAETATD